MFRKTTAALLLALIAAAPAHAADLGSSDTLAATPAELAQTAALGATTSRVMIDPSLPVSFYDEAIQARRDAGMNVQLMIGGMAVGSFPTPAQSVRIARRYPDAYSVSVYNEPQLTRLSGKPCEYRRKFNANYRALKRAGVKRVLFGELAPMYALDYTTSVLRCGSVTADGFAFHGYDADPGWQGAITNLKTIRHYMALAAKGRLHTPRGYALPLFVTEYGVATRGERTVTEREGAKMWSRALRLTVKYRVAQIVAYGVHEAPPGSRWGTSLFTSDGLPRLAAASFR